ncbi:hypothetical protein AUQ48_08255 [Kocuria flava]|uniref:Uncharacterized protein n=1 Tax=Kocuria flava TaxID=446860 RepID=A0A2N4T1W4_9MICC|nr:hypothetical protein AUQ48_08255 [Kocuria flava]
MLPHGAGPVPGEHAVGERAEVRRTGRARRGRRRRGRGPPPGRAQPGAGLEVQGGRGGRAQTQQPGGALHGQALDLAVPQHGLLAGRERQVVLREALGVPGGPGVATDEIADGGHHAGPWEDRRAVAAAEPVEDAPGRPVRQPCGVVGAQVRRREGGRPVARPQARGGTRLRPAHRGRELRVGAGARGVGRTGHDASVVLTGSCRGGGGSAPCTAAPHDDDATCPAAARFPPVPGPQDRSAPPDPSGPHVTACFRS